MDAVDPENLLKLPGVLENLLKLCWCRVCKGVGRVCSLRLECSRQH